MDAREWKEVALALLDRAPDKIEVLKQYIYQLRPMSWSGPRSAAWEANAKLLNVFENHPDAELGRVRAERTGKAEDHFRRASARGTEVRETQQRTIRVIVVKEIIGTRHVERVVG
ncbi:MAG TPA: hypothetical protein VFE38_05045 [Edaphobacter sp.]|nr:hypothetical protein [Edaphobacter sp.]